MVVRRWSMSTLSPLRSFTPVPLVATQPYRTKVKFLAFENRSKTVGEAVKEFSTLSPTRAQLQSLDSPCRATEMQEHAQGSTDAGSNHVNHREALILSHQHDESGKGAPPQLEDICKDLYNKVVKDFLESDALTPLLARLQIQVRISLAVIRESLNKYSFDQLAFAYNGGKDCIVVLVLYLVAIYARHIEQSSGKPPPSDHITSANVPSLLKSVYIQPPDPFPEVDSFVALTAKQYRLDLFASTLPMRQAFEKYLEKDSNVKAVFVGTRRTDPHGGDLTHFNETSRGWPTFIRIHPVINWRYDEIWAFIRHLDIPYCSLYDQGYTSLGGTSDTHPNPSLRIETQNSTGHSIYRPAYELSDENQERLGRES